MVTTAKPGNETPPAHSLAEFLAHAIAMEQEAADRYLELADMMEAHANLEVAALFRDMVRYSTLHRDSIRERAGATPLPRIRSWQYRWSAPGEVGGEEAFDYTLSPHAALEYARANEQRAMQFYRRIADTTADEGMRALAAEFADEEQEHTEALDRMLSATLRS
jgi:rubrerythrin